jgi:hypothetical protein
MEDVSGDTRIANAPSLPKHPVYSGSTTKDKREFIHKYNSYYNTLLSYETVYKKPFIMPVSACIDPWVKDFVARFEFKRSVAHFLFLTWIGVPLKCASKQHLVRQCHQVAEREAEKLIQEYRSKKERETGTRGAQRVQCPSNPKIDPNKIVSAKLEGCLEAKLLLDTGADVSLMPRGLLEKLEQEAEFLKVKKLLEPVEIGTAGSERISVHSKILLESVVLEASAGPLRWRNVECYVKRQIMVLYASSAVKKWRR